jgi:hypothetical protein
MKEVEMTTTFSNDQLPEAAPGSTRERFAKFVQDLAQDVAAHTPEEVLIELMSGIRSTTKTVKAQKETVIIARRLKKHEEIQKILLLRAARATNKLVRDMSYEGTLKSISAATDIGALAWALSDDSAVEDLAEVDPLTGAVGRALGHKGSLLKEAGEMLVSGQVEELLNVSRPAIDKRRKAGKIFGLFINKSWLYPAFQFSNDEVLPGIKTVLSAHSNANQWVVLDVLLSKDEALNGRSLFDVIRENDEEALKRYNAQQKGDGFS